ARRVLDLRERDRDVLRARVELEAVAECVEATRRRAPVLAPDDCVRTAHVGIFGACGADGVGPEPQASCGFSTNAKAAFAAFAPPPLDEREGRFRGLRAGGWSGTARRPERSSSPQGAPTCGGTSEPCRAHGALRRWRARRTRGPRAAGRSRRRSRTARSGRPCSSS